MAALGQHTNVTRLCFKFSNLSWNRILYIPQFISWHKQNKNNTKQTKKHWFPEMNNSRQQTKQAKVTKSMPKKNRNCLRKFNTLVKPSSDSVAHCETLHCRQSKSCKGFTFRKNKCQWVMPPNWCDNILACSVIMIPNHDSQKIHQTLFLFFFYPTFDLGRHIWLIWPDGKNWTFSASCNYNQVIFVKYWLWDKII